MGSRLFGFLTHFSKLVTVSIIHSLPTPGKRPTTTLTDILEPYSLESVEHFLISLYKGSLELPPAYFTLLEMIIIAKTLKIPWLHDRLQDRVADQVSCKTLFETLSLALDYQDEPIKQVNCPPLAIAPPLSFLYNCCVSSITSPLIKRLPQQV